MLICVTLSDPDDWRDHKALLDWGFERVLPVPEKPEQLAIPVTGGREGFVIASSGSSREVCALAEELPRITVETEIPPFLYAPVHPGEEIGRVCYYLDGQLYASVPLTAQTNGHPAEIGQKVDPARDHIQVDGEKLDIRQRETLVYYMLYKPRGYLTAMSDDRGRRCVSELVADIPQRVFPVGRLDLNSEGLLLFTNDGDFANDMTHPSRQVPKTYRVTVHSEVTPEQLVQLSEGVLLDGVRTNPAEVKIAVEEPGRTVMLITITEGRNREIRRMCEAERHDGLRFRCPDYGGRCFPLLC